jgi:hypothetical protein
VSAAAGSDRIRFPGPARDHGELELEIDGRALSGVSVAALATAFAVETCRTAVDMGRCSARLAAQDTVLLTHCHSDHLAGLIAWLSAHTRRHRDRPATVVVPAERRVALLEALRIWPDLDGVRRRLDLDSALVAAGPGTVIPLAHRWSATAFAVHHNTPTLGWAVAAGNGPRPFAVFAGDSSVLPFRADPSLLDAEIAVVDCSFIDPGTRVAARLGGHGHLADWIELLPDLTCGSIVLAHLPPEADARAVLDRLPERLPGTATVVPWIAALGDRR